MMAGPLALIGLKNRQMQGLAPPQIPNYIGAPAPTANYGGTTPSGGSISGMMVPPGAIGGSIGHPLYGQARQPFAGSYQRFPVQVPGRVGYPQVPNIYANPAMNQNRIRDLMMAAVQSGWAPQAAPSGYGSGLGMARPY